MRLSAILAVAFLTSCGVVSGLTDPNQTAQKNNFAAASTQNPVPEAGCTRFLRTINTNTEERSAWEMAQKALAAEINEIKGAAELIAKWREAKLQPFEVARGIHTSKERAIKDLYVKELILPKNKGK